MQDRTAPTDPAADDAGPLPTRIAYGVWREATDIRQRTRLGGAFYIIAWLLCWIFSSAPGAHWAAGLFVTAAFAGLLALRWVHVLPRQVDEATLRHWLRLHWSLILLTAFGWGLVHAWAMASAAFEASRLIAVVATIAFSTAMVFTFPMHRHKALAGVSLLMLPGMVALTLGGIGNLSLLLTLGFYILFLLLALKRGHAEYHTHTDMAFELLMQRERFRELSNTDGLTQLGNRSRFNSLLPVLAASARRHDRELALAMFDIDWFKRINDSHGHAAGDACLVAFADLMRETFRREDDVLVRLGGEEFGVLMPDTPPAQAWQRAEAFRLRVAESPVTWRERQIALTTSGGVGALDRTCDTDPEQLVQRVDRALYAAKARGRNQITASESSALAPAPDSRERDI